MGNIRLEEVLELPTERPFLNTKTPNINRLETERDNVLTFAKGLELGRHVALAPVDH